VNYQTTFYTYSLYLSISIMVIVVSMYLRFYIKVGDRVSTFLPTLTPAKIPFDSDSTALVMCVHVGLCVLYKSFII
jgi:hypothetical protein